MISIRRCVFYVASKCNLTLGWITLCVLACQSASAEILLRDMTADTGIAFKHTDGSSGERYIVEPVGAGLALFDYDGDGDIDIYFLNGAPLGKSESNMRATNALYRNDGDFKFTDVTAKAGVDDTGFGLGVTVGDYDNDGDPDLYLNNYGPNVLYRNDGDGTFTDVTEIGGVDNGDKVGAGACFLDIDQDGDLDLFVANYLKFTYETHVSRTIRGFPQYAGPLDYPPESNTLYRNNGDGTFTDVSGVSGIASHAGTGMGTVCADYDDDGDTDIFVANDMLGNFLFQNDGTGRFEEVGLMASFAYELNGNEQSSMGIDCADYDNDGHLDFYVTSYARELATLYRNLGNGGFEDVGLVAGAASSVLPYVTWGTGFADFDNDGDRDIFIACGHTQDNVEKYDDTTAYDCKNVLLMSTGDGQFVDVSAQAGDGLKPTKSSRGMGLDDLDNDGDIDVVILNLRREPTVLRNDTVNENNWIQIRLIGTESNRDGVGARVKIIADESTQIAEVHSGRSYQSHYGMRLHFGLGERDKIDRIEVRWLGGATDTYENVRVNQRVTLIEADRN